jgi:glycosyltransferase involved in cell wall biosynthesis
MTGERIPLTISVVVSACNRGEFLRETFDSILAHTRPADEIVVVDDGSTDDSVEICRSYGDAIRFIHLPDDFSGEEESRRA